MLSRVALVLFFSLFTPSQTVSLAQTATRSQRAGPDVYRSACAACHGPDGRGLPQAAVGFETPLPDFTDCRFATPEADVDWMAVVHQGGTARAFERIMPAFGEALADEEIAAVVGYLRTFCKENGWPRGDLNLPRPLVTEKAFPENEAVVTTSISRKATGAIGNEFVFERRVGKRGQYELIVPLDVRESDRGAWSAGVGDLAVAYKHVFIESLRRGAIVSAGSELVVPTGSESKGFGGGKTVVEPFVSFSQVLPGDGFVHVHGGLELPIAADDSHVGRFWRIAAGKTVTERRWYRAWSPMLELLGSREPEELAPTEWDVLPQLQVSLSTRQHVLLNAGVRIPVTQRRDRGASVMVYLLWDWFDGGLFTGW